jgi:hypothetical protein
MKCRDFAPLIDELCDGTLDPARASGLRGHARGCAGCGRRLAETEALVDGLAKLEPVDPPASMWAGIAERLNQEEARDAARPRLWWWLQAARPRLALAGAGLAGLAALAFVWWQRPGEAEPARVATPAPVVAPAPAGPVLRDPLDEALADVQRAEAEYRAAVAELDGLVALERPGWSAEVARRFDENLATIDAAIEAQRAAWREGDPTDLRALAGLHASYRKRLDFVQEAVLRGEAGL